MKRIDLHTHSNISDGSLSPAQLVEYAYNKGLSAVALTDHDTIDGLAEAMKTGEELGIEVIPGVEISADFSPELHMLGYFPKGNYTNISQVLMDLRENRNQRNPKMIKRLNELGINITLEEVAQKSSGGVIARPHFASVLLEKGYVRSLKEAFDKYIGNGKPAWVKKDKLSPREMIAEIKKAEGLAVLAHPVHLKMSLERLDKLVAELKSYGLDGLEAYYVDNTGKDTKEFVGLAAKYVLLATGGSDFHGSFKPDIDIGIGRGNLCIDYLLLEKLKACAGL